jgi:hypothetical protein
MSEKSVRPPIEPQSNRRDMADRINRAFATSDITAICQAIGDATPLHNISELARDAKIERTSIYRAFAGEKLRIFQLSLGFWMPWDSSLGSHNAVEIVQSKPENETQNLKVKRRPQPRNDFPNRLRTSGSRRLLVGNRSPFQSGVKTSHLGRCDVIPSIAGACGRPTAERCRIDAD